MEDQNVGSAQIGKAISPRFETMVDAWDNGEHSTKKAIISLTEGGILLQEPGTLNGTLIPSKWLYNLLLDASHAAVQKHLSEQGVSSIEDAAPNSIPRKGYTPYPFPQPFEIAAQYSE